MLSVPAEALPTPPRRERRGSGRAPAAPNPSGPNAPPTRPHVPPRRPRAPRGRLPAGARRDSPRHPQARRAPPAPPMHAAPGEARGHRGGSLRCAPSPSAMTVPRGTAAAQGPEGLPLPDKPRAENAPPPQEQTAPPAGTRPPPDLPSGRSPSSELP